MVNISADLKNMIHAVLRRENITKPVGFQDICCISCGLCSPTMKNSTTVKSKLMGSGNGTPSKSIGLEPDHMNGGLNDYHTVLRARIDVCR